MVKQSWRKRTKGTPRQRGKAFKVSSGKVKGAKKSMFFKAKNFLMADIVKIDTPQHAKESVDDLKTMYNHGGDKKLIRQVTNLASNRAGVISRNKRVSPPQREEAKQVQQIYRKAFEEMKM